MYYESKEKISDKMKKLKDDKFLLIIIIIIGVFRVSELFYRNREEYMFLKVKDRIERTLLYDEKEIKRTVEKLKNDKYGKTVNLKYWIYYLGDSPENYKYIEIFKTIIETRPLFDPTRIEAVRALTKIDKKYTSFIYRKIFLPNKFTKWDKYELMSYFARNGGEEVVDTLYEYIIKKLPIIEDKNYPGDKTRLYSTLTDCIWGLGRIGNEKSIKYLREINKIVKDEILKDIVRQALLEKIEKR